MAEHEATPPRTTDEPPEEREGTDDESEPDDVEKIGVLVVHGMGEQQRGDFVSFLCARLLKAFAAKGYSAALDSQEPGCDPSRSCPLRQIRAQVSPRLEESQPTPRAL